MYRLLYPYYVTFNSVGILLYILFYCMKYLRNDNLTILLLRIRE